MGGKDFCCSVAGTPHIWGVDELLQQLFERVPSDPVRNRITSFRYKGETFSSGGHAISPKVLEGLRFSLEDKEASNDCILIAGYEPVEGAHSDEVIGELYCQMNHEPVVEDINHAVTLFNIIPKDEGVYAKRNNPNDWYNIWWEDAAYYMTFTSYCILKTVAPELDASIIYRTFAYRPNEFEDVSDQEFRYIFLGTPLAIDYGVVEKTFDQYVSKPEVCEDTDTNGFWTHLLCYSDLSDEEILDVAWNGEGNLWAFVRPDRFPIRSAMDSSPLSHFPMRKGRKTPKDDSPPHFDLLPMDILFLICEELPLRTFLHVLSLNNHLRNSLLPHSDELAYKAMRHNDRWYFPALPIKTPDQTRQREELDWWEREWLETGGITADEIRNKAPWLGYWMECSRTASMRNRKRIWGTAESIKTLALKYGFLK